MGGGELVVLLRPALDRSLLRRDGYTVGDVVAFASPGGDGLVLKRVVAVGPGSVSMSDGVVTVDGEVSHFGSFAGFEGHSDLEQLPVPAGALFVLGDNRRPLASRDSRDFGAVDNDAVRGRVIAHLRVP